MKRLLCALLTLAACSAALSLTAAAWAEDPAPTRVWGKVSPWDGEGILLKNDDKNDHLNEVVVHVGDAPAVDAATGLPLDLNALKEGDVLYAWIGPAATMSLPPQVFAQVVVGNVPADAAAPEYYVLTSAGWTDPAGGSQMVFSAKSGAEEAPLELAVPLDAEVTPWLTRQIIRLEDIRPGSQVLVWRGEQDAVSKVLVFPYAYRGTAAWNTAGTGVVNGETVSVPGKVVKNEESGEKQIYLPLRAVAEAAGYSVSWDKNRGAVVYNESVDPVFFAVPGEEVIFRDGEESGISGPCILENGVTYLPARDLCRALNLYYSDGAE